LGVVKAGQVKGPPDKWGYSTWVALPDNRKRKYRRFILGPLPLEWFQVAANLPGKALHIGLALWYLSGLKKSRTIRLTSQARSGFGIGRQALYRQLAALENEGLISVERREGRRPTITILELPLDIRDNPQGGGTIDQ
jgi:DNA-binding transcriptional ArsR family regulator